MGKPLRVLIVEDSKADADLLLLELENGGYEPASERVDTAEAMGDALDKNTWDIILADYVMPSFSGLAALELLQARGIDLPFIVVSGQIGEDIAVATMKAGASDYILKGHYSRLVPALERELQDAEVRRERRKAEQERDRLVEQLRQVNEQMTISSIRMQEQAAELAAIIDALAEALIVFGPAGEIIRMNPVAENLLGYSPEQRGAPMKDRLELLRLEKAEGEPFPAEDAPSSRALLGETVRGVPAVIRRASDGKSVHVQVSASPIRAPDGELRGGVLVLTGVPSPA